MERRKKKLNVRGLKAEARGQWVEILYALAPDSHPALERIGRHVPCPRHGGKDGYRVFKDVADTGAAICNTCGGKTDGIAHIQWINGWTFPETIQAIAEVIGYQEEERRVGYRPRAPRPAESFGPSEEDEQKRIRRDARLREVLANTWEAAMPLVEPMAEPVRLYLARRGLSLQYALKMEVLRCHPKLPYFEGDRHLGDYPALVALVSDASGQRTTLHRTYLTWEGYKADVPAAKKLMPYPSDLNITGGAIRLMEADAPVIAFTEGIETALAVIEATEGQIPVWPTVSDTLLKQVQPEEHIEMVCFYGDQDRSVAGREAVVEAKEKLEADGVQVMGFIPNEEIPETAKSVDWLDMYQKYGAEGVPFPEVVQQMLYETG